MKHLKQTRHQHFLKFESFLSDLILLPTTCSFTITRILHEIQIELPTTSKKYKPLKRRTKRH